MNRFDDDPAVLLGLLASAYARVSPGNADLVADMRGLGVSSLGRAAPRLAAVLKGSPDPFVLMIDDLHELRSPACHDVLSVVISGFPPHSQLITASRFEQPHLPRLRASGDVIEVVTSDLALGVTQAEQVFADAQVIISRDEAVTVTERTEGWAAGLYLAALIARDSRGSELAISGDDRYVADYLYREALAQLPEETQRFLRRTAVLDQMSAPLCDALLGDTNSQDQLRHLEDSNSFLIPLDRRREWYRYHGLFREFLLAELRRMEPEAAAKLHLRAADWYEVNDSPALALEHLLNTPEQDRCVQLLTQLVQPTYSAGQMSVVQRWMTEVGDDAIEQYAPLAVLAAWMGVLSGHPMQAERWLSLVDHMSFDLVPVDGTASFESSRAMLRATMCAAGPEKMISDAAVAIDQEPPWSPWRDTAVFLSAEAYLLIGDEDTASRLFTEASATASELGNTDTIAVGEADLGLIAMNRGDWAAATTHVERSLATVETYRMHDYAAAVIAFVAAARLAAHRGDDADANRHIAAAMRARPYCTYVLPFLAVRARLYLARLHWKRGDASTARHLMREIDEVLLHRPALGVLVDEVDAFRKVVTARDTGAVSGASPLTTAELRLLPYLQTHLTIGEIGERLFISRNTVSTQVASIYRKLGVSKRHDAVEQATAMGLLGG